MGGAAEVSGIFRAGGIAGNLLRATDWSRTPLGECRTWPISLVSIVRAMLGTQQPTCLFWGPALVNLYNDGFIPILGEKHPAAMGQDARDCWRDAWPVVGGLLNDVVANGRSVLFAEMLVPIVRGGRLEDAWWNYSYSPVFDDGGDVAGVLVIATETTTEVNGRRQLQAANIAADLARQELHAVLMQAPLPIALLKGKEHRFVLVNQPYLDLVNRDVREKTLVQAFDEHEVAFYKPHIDSVFASGEPCVLLEAPLRLPDSNGIIQDRFIDVGYHAYRNTEGMVAGVLVVIHDVTAKVLARKRESTLRRAAEEASLAKDEFLAVVSHELRTPLNAILGWSRLLLDATEPRAVQKGLAVIERNATAQARLIEDILDVSRIITGKVVIEAKRARLGDVVQNAVESIRPAATAKRIRLELHMNDPDTAFIADESRLQQVVWNLLSNAVKFTPSDGSISVFASRFDSRVVIRVEDSGKGISPAFLPHVFERFRQDDASTTRHYSGLGLGLAIVRHIVELHGGTVSARSEGDGRGATFEVLIPIRAVEPHSSVLPGDPKSPVDAAASWTSSDGVRRDILVGAHILVVDDEDDARDLVATVLRGAGASVSEARSVAEARAILASLPIGAIVSDIGMPSEDGYSFIEHLRSADGGNPPIVPALALTAFARDMDRRRALAAGFDEHLAKPVDPEELLSAVVSLLKRQSPAG